MNKKKLLKDFGALIAIVGIIGFTGFGASKLYTTEVTQNERLTALETVPTIIPTPEVTVTATPSATPVIIQSKPKVFVTPVN